MKTLLNTPPCVVALCAAMMSAGCGEASNKPSIKADDAPRTTPAPAPAMAPADASVSPASRPLPAGRSSVPSLGAYAAAHEVTVKGSTSLKCETKMIREWLRVTCRGKNDMGGTPTTVEVSRGGRCDTITFAAGGVTSVITPVVEGTDFEAKFSWTDRSHPLVVKWARGEPKPEIIGEFLGAASPLDGTAPSAVICDCHRKVTHESNCADAPVAQPDCERTYAGNCAKLLECARGEASAWPTCMGSTRNVGATGWCASLCGPGMAACSAGSECTRDWGEPHVCL